MACDISELLWPRCDKGAETAKLPFPEHHTAQVRPCALGRWSQVCTETQLRSQNGDIFMAQTLSSTFTHTCH